ncbi:hypothetical protein [Pseudomonas sp. dw_358]|uniref:hypothetical protein n=1 Tax=Pseudomonas sp. dw_358 TaxID=2720083 RepID=UPI001BD28204|nr:hypothetical protein [Pseudomonas sp. dw_358]
MEEIEFTLCSVPMLMSRNKSSEYQERMLIKLDVLMRFLKDNELILDNPFEISGALNTQFVLKKSGADPKCVELFKKVIPAWFAFLDKGGDPKNMSRLEKGLAKMV